MVQLFHFSYFFLKFLLNPGASTCHLETDMAFLPLKINTSTACLLASKDEKLKKKYLLILFVFFLSFLE